LRPRSSSRSLRRRRICNARIPTNGGASAALWRKLLDIGDAANAYEVVRTAATPANPYYRAEFHHMAGWIALRFLHDPAKAQKHFARADEGITDPVPVARAAYWRGRAAEAAGQLDEMRAQYQAAARYPVAYYGQLARARLGLNEVVELRSPPQPADAKTSEATIGSARATSPWRL
jgi:soluble lytic murein transglycosylase